MANKPKLLFIVNVDWFFLSHRLPIALEAINAGYDVSLSTGITDRLEVIQTHGINVYPLSFNRGDSSPTNALNLFSEILKLYQSLKPDIVHLVTLKAILIGGLAARVARISSVVAAVSGLGFTFSDQTIKAKIIRKISSQLYQLSLKHPNTAVIVQNTKDLAVIKSLSSLPDSVFHLLPGSGVDLETFYPHPYPEGEPVILMASRMLYSKGVREFVLAAQHLQKTDIKAHFVLVGAPDSANPRSVTTETLEQWHKQGWIEWWGHQTDMAKIIAKCHIFVLPSYYGEGLPKVLIEASACGRAIITTDTPGCRDAIEVGVTGLLVPPKDPQSLSSAIQSLIQNPELYITMGQAGRKRAEEVFSIQSIVSAHLDIYKHCIQSQCAES